MTLEKLTSKQKTVLKWAHMESTRQKYHAIICDGAVRSGKTVVMSVSFIHWAMRFFDGKAFAICGKTVESAERNIISLIMGAADITGFYSVNYSKSEKKLTVTNGRRKNLFYVFGGKDESSYMAIQGMTLCGVFFDEVALMPRSFVDQAVARTLSVDDSKLWFNCNPDNPNHWFYREWILDADGENKKHILHLHFSMEDNPILSKATIEKAKTLYSGAFLRRYIYGEWVAADGLVYPMFDDENVMATDDVPIGKCFVSIDYGTHNPCSMGLWNVYDGAAYRIREFYYDSVAAKRQLTDEEYYDRLVLLCKDMPVKSVVVDPSALSFITLIRRHGEYNVIPAKNDVGDGIRLCSSLLNENRLKIDSKCKDILREFSLYCWDDTADFDKVKKVNDHAMDDMRYFCATILKRNDEFLAKGKNVTFSDYFGDLFG